MAFAPGPFSILGLQDLAEAPVQLETRQLQISRSGPEGLGLATGCRAFGGAKAGEAAAKAARPANSALTPPPAPPPPPRPLGSLQGLSQHLQATARVRTGATPSHESAPAPPPWGWLLRAARSLQCCLLPGISTAIQGRPSASPGAQPAQLHARSLSKRIEIGEKREFAASTAQRITANLHSSASGYEKRAAVQKQIEGVFGGGRVSFEPVHSPPAPNSGFPLPSSGAVHRTEGRRPRNRLDHGMPPIPGPSKRADSPRAQFSWRLDLGTNLRHPFRCRHTAGSWGPQESGQAQIGDEWSAVLQRSSSPQAVGPLLQTRAVPPRDGTS